MIIEVGLEQAWHWECPSCGRDRFVKGVIAELNSDERQELSVEHGIEFSTGDYFVRPDSVTCDDCGKEFRVCTLVLDDEMEEDE